MSRKRRTMGSVTCDFCAIVFAILALAIGSGARAADSSPPSIAPFTARGSRPPSGLSPPDCVTSTRSTPVFRGLPAQCGRLARRQGRPFTVARRAVPAVDRDVEPDHDLSGWRNWV